jgi:hypothetical protein
MKIHELIINLHMHTTYSDGGGSHADLARAALASGLDAALVTDHNVWVGGVEQYCRSGKRRALLLVGEEIHDQGRDPQKNHLLVFGAERELAAQAHDPQALVDAARTASGLSFIAHPIDPALPAFGEADISWEDWNLAGYTGLELWNGFSELKTVVRGKLDGLFHAYFPQYIARGPHPEALRIWDGLLASGRRVVAVGGSDAHATLRTLGPLRKVIFPYKFHFSAINTHLLVPGALSGDLPTDRRMIYSALAAGHAFIGYDLPAPTRGFRFSAQGKDKTAWMGDELPLNGGVTLQVKAPARADLRLLKDGEVIKSADGEFITHITTEPGVYRVEAYRRFLGKKRGWIFSNPIYVRSGRAG